jgi:hypothetical protein
MQYNYQKYIELLKYEDSLRKQNKFLEDENKLKELSKKFKIGPYNPNSTLFKRITQLSILIS